MRFEKYFDHTMLKPDASEEEILQLCTEGLQYEFASVCVNPCRTALAARVLKGSTVKVCTVIGFPLGASPTLVKVCETEKAVKDGAQEIDMVLHIGALKDHAYKEVLTDIEEVKRACGGALLKVIIETCLLTDEEKVRACELAVEAGADYVKTSTGFSSGGATVEDVALMRRTVGERAGVKASGGIRDLQTDKAMIEAGADRLGTSATVQIVKSVIS